MSTRLLVYLCTCAGGDEADCEEQVEVKKEASLYSPCGV